MLKNKYCKIFCDSDILVILQHMDDNLNIDESKFKFINGLYSYGDAIDEVSLDEFCKLIDEF